MLNTYLPYITALVAAALTAYVNYQVGKLKNEIAVKTLESTADIALRDDLLTTITHYEGREQSLVTRLQQSEAQNITLQTVNADLRIQLKDCLLEKRELTADLQQACKKLKE